MNSSPYPYSLCHTNHCIALHRYLVYAVTNLVAYDDMMRTYVFQGCVLCVVPQFGVVSLLQNSSVTEPRFMYPGQ